ncbi:MAG: Rrf2 family transcriptional regulator [Firmicutes bacterium]|nr:Rrf2 family transcriptional regulator [Bacillota bacterium]
MRLTRKAEYAIRAMVDLATNYNQQPVMSKEIAVRQDIPVKFLIQIIPDLKSSGLIHTSRGNGGGIYLAKKPSEINIKHIVEAIEGPIALNNCLTGDSACSRKQSCSLHKVWRLAQEQMVSVLESTTLAALTLKRIPAADGLTDSNSQVSNETEIDV